MTPASNAVYATLLSSTLEVEDAVRDAEWTEQWALKQEGSYSVTVSVVNTSEGDLLIEKDDFFAHNSFFTVGNEKVSAADILLSLWFVGEGGPGMADVGDTVQLEPEWVTHARNAGVVS